MVDSSSCWPVPASICFLEEPIAFFEQEMIINQLILNFFSHASQWEVFSFQLPI